MSDLLNKMQWRYATKKMDATKVVPQDKVDRIVEAARLAPTSSGLQPFEVLVVTNPEVSSVRDSDRILGILASKSRRAEQAEEPVREHLVLTRYSPERVEKGDMLSVDDVMEILAIPLLGVIPESSAVLQSSNSGVPVVLDEQADAGVAYADLVARFLGEERSHRFLSVEKKGFFKRLFGN